jgi:glycosyltransferase involved in cell wall biosynthesis
VKIAMVSEHASPLATLGGVDAGGQNVHVEALAATLVALGHSVTVYTRRDNPRLDRRTQMLSGVVIEHVDAGPPRPIAKDAIFAHVRTFGNELQRAWKRDRPDIVHAHFWMSGLAALAAAKPLGIPVVQTYHALGIEKRRHQGDADTSPELRIAEEATIARAVDAIVATSAAEAFELVRMGARASDVTIVPCGVDIERFTPGGAQEQRRSERLRIGTLSRLVPRKGIDTVIDAVANIANAELVIAGGGESADLATDPEAQRLAARARARGIGHRTYLRGRLRRDEAPAFLRSCDLVACVPWYEPFGIVPLEAMACGVPVVVSSVGGLIDTVVDGVTGFHVPPHDPRALAGAIDALQRDPELRRAMGVRGVERARNRYSWQRVASSTLAVYGKLIDRLETEPVAIG